MLALIYVQRLLVVPEQLARITEDEQFLRLFRLFLAQNARIRGKRSPPRHDVVYLTYCDVTHELRAVATDTAPAKSPPSVLRRAHLLHVSHHVVICVLVRFVVLLILPSSLAKVIIHLFEVLLVLVVGAVTARQVLHHVGVLVLCGNGSVN